jgi:hypothetical protein
MKMEIDGGENLGKAAKGADSSEDSYSSGNEFHELYNSDRAS